MPGTRKLGRTSDSRNAMMRAMVTYLLENGKMTYQWWIGKCNELTMHKFDPVSHTPEDKFSACQVDAIADQVWAEGEVERQYTELKQALVDAAAPQDVEPGAAKFDDETHVNQIV